ncbi:MAG: EAL domain-containing protein [Thiotrichaceae bacterium]|nr:EAL domain-containing protein [Thiotrichaceae bacterium]
MEMLNHWDGELKIEILDDNDFLSQQSVVSSPASDLVITGVLDNDQFLQYKRRLHEHSAQTILVTQAAHISPLQAASTGVEYCSLSQIDPSSNYNFISMLLSYIRLKNRFRHCKQLLYITDQRNRWIVDTTQEPIAYLGKDTHLHANSAYLSLFNFHSESQLQSSSIWDLIPVRSKNMFKNFVRQQSDKMDMQQSLLLTMNTVEGVKLRASLRIGLAVFNKSKCLQVWVHKIERGVDFTPDELPSSETGQVSPWETLPVKNKKQKNSPFKFNNIRKHLSQVEVNISRLHNDQSSKISHYWVTLEKTQEDIKLVKQLAKKMSPSCFWDSVLITELVEKVKHHHDTKDDFLVSLNEKSMVDKGFIQFLLSALKSLSEPHPAITILIPYLAFKRHHKQLSVLNHTLKKLNCSLGMTEFIPSGKAIQQVMLLDPKYIIFSAEWLKKIPENDQRFTRLIQHMENKGINLILP